MKQTRNTLAKTEILNLMTQSGVALSQAEIQAALSGLCDRVTIYRVLDRLTREGFVHRVVNTDGVVKYAGCHGCSARHHHNHVHFSCNNCKAVTCLESVRPSFRMPARYTVSEINFIVSGLCPQCS